MYACRINNQNLCAFSKLCNSSVVAMTWEGNILRVIIHSLRDQKELFTRKHLKKKKNGKFIENIILAAPRMLQSLIKSIYLIHQYCKVHIYLFIYLTPIKMGFKYNFFLWKH